MRIPVEGLIVVALVLVLPTTARRVVAALVGLLLGLLTIVKILDMGFFEALDRPFNPVERLGLLRSGGRRAQRLDRPDRAPSASWSRRGLLVVAILVLMPLAVMRLTRLAARPPDRVDPRRHGARGRLGPLCRSSAPRSSRATPIASTSAAGLAYDQVVGVRDAVQDRQVFAKQIAPTTPSATRRAPTC